MRKQLPFTKEVPMCTYVYHAAILGIIGGEYEKYAPWINSHFIQIFTGTKCGPFGFFDMVFKEFPFIQYQTFRNTTLLDMNIDINQFIKNNLDNGWYIYADLDENFIENRHAYKKYSFVHSNLIFGYNDELRRFNIAGYVKSKNKKSEFGIDVATYEEIKNAFLNTRIGEVTLLKLNDFTPKFDYNLVVESLYDYVYSQNTSSRVRAKEEFSNIKRTYGIKTMELLQTRLNEIIEFGYNERYTFDLRIFRVLWEHKKIMYNRFVYMNNMNYSRICDNILNEYKEIVKGYEVLFMFAKKVYLTKSTEPMPKMIERIGSLVCKEKNILLQVLDILIEDSKKFNLEVY